MQRAFKWFLLLNKRLYKKWSFVAILALLLISVCLFTYMAKSESGFVHVLLVQTDKNDEISSRIVDKLLSEDSLILFTEAESPDEALKLVRDGKADSVWIFPEDMKESLYRFAKSRSTDFITIYEREQSVFTRISREKLFASLFDDASKAFFVRNTREKIPSLDNLSDDELLSYYDNVKITDELFILQGGENPSGDGSVDYLTLPLRGFLGIITTLGGMAAAMYYMQDEENRTFAWVPEKKRFLVGIGSISVATLNLSLVSMITLCVSGLYKFKFTEIVCALLYAVCTAVFCMLLRQIFKSINLFGAAIPVLSIILCCVCPVFFKLKGTHLLSLLLPPTYYINAGSNNMYLLYMLGYCTVCFGLCLLIDRLKRVKF